MKTDIKTIVITYDYSGKGATILFNRGRIARHYKYNSDMAMRIHHITLHYKAEYYSNKIVIYC